MKIFFLKEVKRKDFEFDIEIFELFEYMAPPSISLFPSFENVESIISRLDFVNLIPWYESDSFDSENFKFDICKSKTSWLTSEIIVLSNISIYEE